MTINNNAVNQRSLTAKDERVESERQSPRLHTHDADAQLYPYEQEDEERRAPRGKKTTKVSRRDNSITLDSCCATLHIRPPYGVTRVIVTVSANTKNARHNHEYSPDYESGSIVAGWSVKNASAPISTIT